MRAGLLLLAAVLCLEACGGQQRPGAEGNLRKVSISTSSWKPGDAGMDALLHGTLKFTRDGCPTFEHGTGVVWPAGFTSVVKPDGEHVVVTTDGREIAAGDTVVAGGGNVGTAKSGMACIPRGASLMYIESTVRIIRGH